MDVGVSFPCFLQYILKRLYHPFSMSVGLLEMWTRSNMVYVPSFDVLLKSVSCVLGTVIAYNGLWFPNIDVYCSNFSATASDVTDFGILSRKGYFEK